MPDRRFYFFFIEIWPQEVYYFTGLLILAAMALFLMNAVAGRIWCGYLCPQTVWTDLFQAVERWIEGDRRERMQRDRGRWTRGARRATRRQAFLWLMIAWWTGGAWVLYFADAPTLVQRLATLQAPFVAYALDRHPDLHDLRARRPHARAGLPLYVPVAAHPGGADRRIRAQRHLSLRSRRAARLGQEDRGAARAQGEPAGDCIDCLQCVHVCPTGVDIRDGPDLGCIQCGLCIDACDAVMAKIGRPARLIAYDTDINIKRRAAGPAAGLSGSCARARCSTRRSSRSSAPSWSTRWRRAAAQAISVIHDRNPLFVRLSDGAIRNAYTVRIVNKRVEPRDFALSVDGPRRRR